MQKPLVPKPWKLLIRNRVTKVVEMAKLFLVRNSVMNGGGRAERRGTSYILLLLIPTIHGPKGARKSLAEVHMSSSSSSTARTLTVWMLIMMGSNELGTKSYNCFVVTETKSLNTKV